MPINSIYYSFFPPSHPLSLLKPQPGFVFWAPNGRRCIYFQTSSSQPTGFLVFKLHAEIETEKKKSHCNYSWIPVGRKLQEPGETIGFWKARLKAPLGCRKAVPLIKSKQGNLKQKKKEMQYSASVFAALF